MLIPRLSSVHQRLNRLHTRFGDPRYLPVSIIVGNQTIILTPNLKVTQIDPGKVGMMLSENVQLMGDEWMIDGISRVVPLESLRTGTWKIDGRIADLVYLDEAKSPVYVRAIVRYRDSGK